MLCFLFEFRGVELHVLVHGKYECCHAVLMLVEDERGDHIEEAYTRDGLMTVCPMLLR